MSIKNIKDVLSREEMKSIMAGYGVNCQISAWYGGTLISYSGGCSGGSVSACNGYARNVCNQHGSWGASQCSFSCY